MTRRDGSLAWSLENELVSHRIETKRDRSIAPEITTRLFDVPVPSLVLTGDAVGNERSDARFYFEFDSIDRP